MLEATMKQYRFPKALAGFLTQGWLWICHHTLAGCHHHLLHQLPMRRRLFCDQYVYRRAGGELSAQHAAG